MQILYADISNMKDAFFDRYLEELSEFRKEKIRNYRFEADRKRSFAAGVLLAAALKEKGICEKHCAYEVFAHGKTGLKAYPDISFNISHSGNLAAVIIQFPDETDKGMDSACGIDIEQIKSGRNKVAERFFSEEENKILRELSEKEAEIFFAKMWTRREAFGKCIGNGLDFSDALQREIMNEKLMAEHSFYFRDKLLADSLGETYVLNACAKEKTLLDAADISDYSHVFSSQDREYVL